MKARNNAITHNMRIIRFAMSTSWTMTFGVRGTGRDLSALCLRAQRPARTSRPPSCHGASGRAVLLPAPTRARGLGLGSRALGSGACFLAQGRGDLSADDPLEILDPHGLHEMVIEARVHRPALVLLPAIAGQGHESHV